MTLPLSGARYDIASDDYTASIASVGASLRSLQHAGRDLVVPFDADAVRPVFRGATLAPWPNRIVNGRYTFAGVEQELALTEPSRGHALHGLVAWAAFSLEQQSPDSVRLATTIEAQQGYPHRVRVVVDYNLDADGLHETVTATNTGPDAAPFGTGPHPYLVAGPGKVNDWTLASPAQHVLTMTPDRLIPIETVDVSTQPQFDFREPRTIGDTCIDHAFTAFAEPRITITTSEGSGVSMTWDAACTWVQIHTADRPNVAESRLGLAVEPMTCPPDAFNSGIDVITVEPGASTAASWTIAAVIA
ncbi:MAG: aldose 1-epimerase family protein [Microbacteriaceae bacterium]